MNLGCALPEVYLMLAECEARAGLESESVVYLKSSARLSFIEWI